MRFLKQAKAILWGGMVGIFTFYKNGLLNFFSMNSLSTAEAITIGLINILCTTAVSYILGLIMPSVFLTLASMVLVIPLFHNIAETIVRFIQNRTSMITVLDTPLEQATEAGMLATNSSLVADDEEPLYGLEHSSPVRRHTHRFCSCPISPLISLPSSLYSLFRIDDITNDNDSGSSFHINTSTFDPVVREHELSSSEKLLRAFNGGR